MIVQNSSTDQPLSGQEDDEKKLTQKQIFVVSIFSNPTGFSVTAQARKLVNEKKIHGHKIHREVE